VSCITRVQFLARTGILFFIIMSIPALGLTQLYIQWIRWIFPPKVKTVEPCLLFIAWCFDIAAILPLLKVYVRKKKM
jgi:hypothetical protein